MKHIKKLIWKLRIALVGKSLHKFRKLKCWQWLDREQTFSLQQERLKHLLLHAYQHAPYYREVLTNAEVVDDSGMLNLKCFTHIPLLDKYTIRLHLEGLKSDDLTTRKWYENTSGGSTGKPVRLIQDKDFHGWKLAVKMLYDLWSGYLVGEMENRTVPFFNFFQLFSFL